MEITVRFCAARFSACKTVFSVSASRLAVISSSKSNDGPAAVALAIDNNCHCPWENSSGVHMVSYPWFQSFDCILKPWTALLLSGLTLRYHFHEQSNLISDSSRHHMEALFHIAKQAAALFLADLHGRDSVDQYISLQRLIQAEK